MLRLVEQQASSLLKVKRASLRTLQRDADTAKKGDAAARTRAAAQLDAAQGEEMALQAILILAQQLVAIALTKLLMLRRDALVAAADAIAQAPTTPAADAAAAAGGSGGAQGARPPRVSVQGSSMTEPPAGAAAAGDAAAGAAAAAAAPAAGRSNVSPPPADSASSTLEGLCSLPLGTWASSLQTLSSCMRQYAHVGQLWQAASSGARAMYKEASALAAGAEGDAAAPPPPAWARVAHTAAAQIISLGYEWGVWDLLGSIMVARRVLESVAHLPGIATQ